MNYLKKLQYNSPVILSYAIICFIILILDFFTNDFIINTFFILYPKNMENPLFYFTLFTHILGHIDFEHFFNNFLIILIIGPILEEKYGSYNILILILITSFIIGITQIIFSSKGLLGASGIAFMLIVLSSFVNIKKGKIPLTIILVVFIYIGKEIYYGIILNDSISQFSHIVGGICGVFLGIAINKKYYKKRS